MHPAIRPLSYLLVSTFCLHCATPQQGVSLESPNVFISCAYVERGRRFDETEAECIMTNQAMTPTRIIFKQVSLEDPHAEIEPINTEKIKISADGQEIIMILGVIIIVGGIIALLSKAKAPTIHIPIIVHDPFSALDRPAKIPSPQPKTVLANSFEIPADRTIRFIFLAKHGTERPQQLAIRLGDNPDTLIKVPIKTPPGWSRKRSDW